tara:strand:- start:324 stop:563 length:240 start_codon:yes stop_codon:yes gene_type:complete
MKVTDIITNELVDRFRLMPTQEIVSSLVEDMEMLRNRSWEPDDDSIDAHVDLIAELFRRANESSEMFRKMREYSEEGVQ